MSENLVVVGACLAGLRAAESARKAGFDGSIILIGSEKHLPYDRPPLSKQFLMGESDIDYYRTAEEMTDHDGIDLRLGTTATGLDVAGRIVETDAGPIPFDRLVITTGASPRTLPDIPALDGIVTLRTMEDSRNLRERITSGTRLVVLGAGFIGSEIASSATKLGAQVTIIEAAPIPLVRAVGDVVGLALAGLHERNGTRLLLQTQITDYIGTDRLEAVRLSTGELLPADIVVVGIGAAPATQ